MPISSSNAPAAGRTPSCGPRAPIMQAVEPLLWRHRGHKTQTVPSAGPERLAAAPGRAARLHHGRNRAARIRRGRLSEHFQVETLHVSTHTACRFAEKTRFFRSLWAGRRCAAASRLAFFKDKTLHVAQIPCATAREVIRREHYSHSVVNNSYLHLGVFREGAFEGVLQWGYALIPARADKVVAGTAQGQYMKLNRMWLSDDAPRNSESRAISYALKYIRRACPSVAWVQSYADERC